MNQAFFTNIESMLIINLTKAQISIKVAVAWFKNPSLYSILKAKQQQGVDVEVIMADDNSNFNNVQVPFQDLIDEGGKVSVVRHRLMHHKFCLIDGTRLITGSYNWTRGANHNFENVIVSTDLSLIIEFQSEFRRIKENSEAVINISQTNFQIINSINSSNESDNIEIKFFAPENTLSQPVITMSTSVLPQTTEELDGLLNQAASFYLQGKHEKALNIADAIIKINPNIPEVYDLIATIKWRQKDYKSVVNAANKAIELDNLYYPAYNMLGIGYAGQETANESLKNYKICLEHEPANYTVHWNMALSYQDLQDAPSIPITLRNQFKRNFEEKIATTVTLTSQQEETNPSYQLYSTRGQAFMNQRKFHLAKNDLLKALTLYNATSKNEQDVHILCEIKSALKEVDWCINQ